MDYASSNLRSAQSENYNSESIKRNTYIFGFLMMFLQLAISLIYGFLINISTATLNISSVIVIIGLAILIIGGNY